MKRATFMAFVSVAMAASRNLGALPGGFITDTLGFEWVFIVSSLISLIGGIFVVAGIRKRKSVQAETAQTVPASAGLPSQPTKVRILRLLFAQGAVAILFFFGFGALDPPPISQAICS
jgi:MFS family permease